MLQLGLFGFGLVFICISLLMFFVARPVQGVVVGFLRDKPNLQAWYAMAVMVIFVLGAALLIRGSAE
jgi:threonine/homoserine/homoserine lactone efflux protein